MKLCLIYNFAHHYREEIFRYIDNEFDCDFYFGDKYLDVKKMDTSILRGKCVELHNIYSGPFIFQKGVLPLIRKYDVFLMNGDLHSVSTWIFLILSRLFKDKKIYFWNHGWYGKEKRWQAVLKKIFYSFTTGIFVYSYYAKNLMVVNGIDEGKIHVIHNSLSYSKQLAIRCALTKNSIYTDHFGNEKNNLIFVGRLSKVKHLDMLIDVICKDNEEKYNLTFIGDGEERNVLVSEVMNKGIEKRVWFFGACYDEQVLGNLIYNADLCIAPGNVGLTAVHAMVYGCPVLTHRDSKWQMPEFEAIKEGATGAFFEKDDIDSLFAVINNWFDTHSGERDQVRKDCMSEIDDSWTPSFQIKVFKEYLKG